MIIIAVGAVAVTKVKYASRKKVPPTAACQHLYISKCYELANYYLGFNAWNVTITSVSVDAFWVCWLYLVSENTVLSYSIFNAKRISFNYILVLAHSYVIILLKFWFQFSEDTLLTISAFDCFLYAH